MRNKKEILKKYKKDTDHIIDRFYSLLLEVSRKATDQDYRETIDKLEK